MKHPLFSNLLNTIGYSIGRDHLLVIVTSIRDDGIGEKALLTESAELIEGRIDEATIENIKNILPPLLAKQCKVFVGNVSNQEDQEKEVIIEVLHPKRRMLVFGAGHVGQAVALMGSLIGYKVEVYDDREEFLDRIRFPDPRIDLHCCDFSNLRDVLDKQYRTGSSVYSKPGCADHAGKLRGAIIIIVTRGHQYDEECLRAVVDSSASYIGMIGSTRRVMSIIRRLQDSGVDRTRLGRVHAPIGLKIGAVTPQEIAVAIVAQVIQEIHSSDGKGSTVRG